MDRWATVGGICGGPTAGRATPALRMGWRRDADGWGPCGRPGQGGGGGWGGIGSAWLGLLDGRKDRDVPARSLRVWVLAKRWVGSSVSSRPQAPLRFSGDAAANCFGSFGRWALLLAGAWPAGARSGRQPRPTAPLWRPWCGPGQFRNCSHHHARRVRRRRRRRPTPTRPAAARMGRRSPPQPSQPCRLGWRFCWRWHWRGRLGRCEAAGRAGQQPALALICVWACA